MTNHGKLAVFFGIVVFVGGPFLGNLAKKDNAELQGKPIAAEEKPGQGKGSKRKDDAPAAKGPALTPATLVGTSWDVPMGAGKGKVSLLAGGIATVQSAMGPGQGQWTASGTSVTISCTVAGQQGTLTGTISGDSLTLNGQRVTRSK